MCDAPTHIGPLVYINDLLQCETDPDPHSVPEASRGADVLVVALKETLVQRGLGSHCIVNTEPVNAVHNSAGKSEVSSAPEGQENKLLLFSEVDCHHSSETGQTTATCGTQGF